MKDLNVGTPRGQFLLVLPGGGTVFGGRAFENSDQVGFVKTAPNGNIVYNKRLDGVVVNNLSSACLTKDKNILIATGASLVLLDTNGVVLKSAATAMSFGGHFVYDLKTDALENVYVLYEASGGGNKQHLLTKISPDLSTILWSVTFGTLYSSPYRNILIDGDKVFATGGFPTAQLDSTVGSVLCFNAANGALVKQVSFVLDGYQCFMSTMHKTSGGYLLEGHYLPNGQPYFSQHHVIVRLNDSLLPVKAARVNGVLNEHVLFIEPDEQGGFYASATVGFMNFFHADRQDSVTWSRIIIPNSFGVNAFATTAANLYALDNSCWTLVKTDLNGRAGGCNEAPGQISTVPVTPLVVSKSLTPTAGGLSIGPVSNGVFDKTFAITRDCKSISTCSSLKIIGVNGICTNATSVVFKGRRNPGCRLPVRWQINGSSVNSSVINDSTLSVQFTTGGRYQCIASLPSDCQVISDTIDVDVTLTSQPALNLGSDKELCSGNVIVLNAHQGYRSYLWQDGSTDSTFTVTQPGLYYVTTTDACGGIYKDSITIIVAPPIPFEVSPDRTKCNGDTLHFNAPSGFLNYAWSPQYNISSTTQAAVTVNPFVDTAYFVRAEKTPGCFAYDTIRIRVYQSPAINLGPDINLCGGDSLTLDAGVGFSTYTWNGVGGTQTKTVRAAGSYAVAGITREGCKSVDTLQVLNLWLPPRIALDRNPSLCLGTTRTLNPGTFSSYLWQDGNQSATYTVKDTGKYWVSVMDLHNCLGSDTVSVTTILPLPRAFLPADTALCSYGTILLKTAHPFAGYTWSNGSLASAITINKPGDYWLQVIDQYGCSGIDTIVVNPKQCMTGLYIPTAFTPNQDNKNDAFKAAMFGTAKKFNLTVYNRWGEIVFYTVDPGRGWDGKLGGTPQQTGVYVWTCLYQLDGSRERFERGTVTLVR